MTLDASVAEATPPAARAGAPAGVEVTLLRRLAVSAGLAWAVLFVVIGPAFRLQLYGDGSIFSYGVAVEDVWAFHFHNIPDRLFVYLFCSVPAEAYVHLTGDARGGIAVYGILFCGAQLLGLLATYAADRSADRRLFVFACGSTACFCPFVFGFPTEMWLAHALFWPTLALAHYAPRGIGGFALVFAALLALALTHEGALVLEVVILATLALRGVRDAAPYRALLCFLVVVLIWTVVKQELVPDDYIVAIMHRAAFDFIDVTHLSGSNLFRLIVAALAGYALVVPLVRRFTPAHAHMWAAPIVLLALGVYWLAFDHALLTQNRYYLRTLLLLALPATGGLAAAYALRDAGRLALPLPLLPRLMDALAQRPVVMWTAGAIVLMSTAHAVETTKFVAAWREYKVAVRALATGTQSDPELGDPRFVSAARIPAELDRLSWPSTTPFLSVLLAPGLMPTRLVVDPRANYFWLPCDRAEASESAKRAIPLVGRRLVRLHACLHR